MLLFVPGVTPADSNRAMRVAEVIASSQSRMRQGTYSVKIEPRETAQDGAASILDPNGACVLRVVDVDYRARLAETPYGSAAQGWALLRAGRFALLGILRLLAARRESKTSRHRWFLLTGFALVLLLIGAFVVLGVAALGAVGIDGARPFEDWNQLALGAGLVTAAGAMWWLRGKMLDGGRRVRELVRYLERDREAASVALALDVVIDQILDESPDPPAIHILAYSFGSIVALDALFPRVLPRPIGADRCAAAVTTLVTVGSPVDFVRQFYPEYFDGRTARRGDLVWSNLFLPEDILSSNFLDNDDHSGFEEPPAGGTFQIAGVSPVRSIAVGHERLTLKSLLSLEGFRVHGDYWDQSHRANLLEPVIPQWLP